MHGWKAPFLGTILFLAGCGDVSPVTPHAVLQTDLDPLRAAFNADIDKVRVVMLVAPT